MRAMVLEAAHQPLRLHDLPTPIPNSHQLLLQVNACGICRTDLHILDGELPHPQLPLVMGHQIVGTVVDMGDQVAGFSPGQRVGVPWLGYTCQHCRFCCSGRENLCENAQFTGYDLNGGYAEFAIAEAQFCFPLPADYPDLQVAPLLCAGLIGYRAYRMTGNAHKIGFYGFGAAAHILIQVAQFYQQAVYAFTRPGDQSGQAFARHLGAVWAGGSDELPPEPLDAAIIFAPVGALIPAALQAVDRGGKVICAGIHMTEIPAFSYATLWHEKSICSVANLTRQDGEEFLALAPQIPIHTVVAPFALEEANAALAALRQGEFNGAAVLVVTPEPG